MLNVLARHDTLIAIVGTAVLTVAFYFGSFRPGQTSARQVETEIAQVQSQLDGIPLLLAEQSQMRTRLAYQQKMAEQLSSVVPTEVHASEVVHEVASMAQKSGLTLTRLEPLPQVDFAAYSAQPFRLGCRGEFQNIAKFLAGLESQTRLLTFGEVTLTRGNEARGPESGGNDIQANLDFSVYSRHAKTTNVAENASSQGLLTSDN